MYKNTLFLSTCVVFVKNLDKKFKKKIYGLQWKFNYQLSANKLGLQLWKG